MKTKALSILVAMALLCVPVLASAEEAPRFGIGVNSSLMAARTFGAPDVQPSVSPGVPSTAGTSSLPATGTGTVSLRWWATPRFAIEPNIGVSVRDDAAAVSVGLRLLYSFALKKTFRANVGLDALAPIITGGGAGTSVAPAAGPLFGVEYFFDEEKTFSFEVYVGIPVIFPIENVKFGLDIGGNIMAGFHFYLW